MESFTVRDLKAEKANAILRYGRLQKFAALIRLVEIGVFLIMISRVSAQLPITVKGFGDSFRDASDALLSPRFVFVVGNAIVIILFVKSGQLSPADPSAITAETSSILDRFVEKHVDPEKNGTVVVVAAAGGSSKDLLEINHYRSSDRAENAAVKPPERSDRRELRRSETERRERDSDEFRVKQLQRSYSEDDMSNEEFRRKVEAFIARQQRFLREEETL